MALREPVTPRSLAFAAAALALMAVAAPVHADDAFRLSLDAGRLSLHAEAVPLQRVLDEVYRLTGIRVRVDGRDAEVVTAAFERLTVDDAIRRLLRDRDFVLVYREGRLQEARVYVPDPTSPAASPRSDEAVADLRREALTNENPDQRLRALETLAANIDERAAVEVIVEMLGRETSPALLERALDIVGDDRALPLERVLSLAVDNPSPRVRSKALTRLAAHAAGDPRARQTLEVRAVDDPERSVREVAEALLKQLAAK